VSAFLHLYQLDYGDQDYLVNLENLYVDAGVHGALFFSKQLSDEEVAGLILS